MAAVTLGLFLSFIIIFLEPFDTNEYESNYRLPLLLGFGIVLSLLFFIHSSIEKIWFKRLNRTWLVSYEILSITIFFALAGTAIYAYNHFVVNGLEYTLESHVWYYTHIVSVMIPVIAPMLIFLRQKFGELTVPVSENEVLISGENKNEILKLEKNELLYVKAVENYIEIFFVDSTNKLQSKTFRQTLSKVHLQIPFLEKCHRSYLVNLNTIKEIQGNSQGAKIAFHQDEITIPLSKTLYKSVKNKVL
jgi:hypothetical protein